ncbi:NAD-glutamate dehydrogenase domain-containing protein [Sediminicoccus rosea]|uniref:NAD-glutamate dehydrogenase n=1 Tax=Sediminicoccus rosea TaxID=1225128 RepID=A0ABZ0PKN4_9PROT|nr:NAD-glutamate dehydrogenase domain-containing protein [Sediminicoccus rosea]WPB85932.1 NAD-glutamate dehydrogenase [Sediminicoccus rosea]
MPEAPMSQSPDSVREEVLRAAREGLPPAAAALLPALHAAIPTAELAARPPESLREAAASLAALAARRAPGEAKLRLTPPGSGRGAHGVAEIIVGDMPFLVDSVLAALTRQGRVVREFLHPVLPVTRDATGALLALGEGEARESMMRVTIGASAGHLLPGMEPQGPHHGWPEVEAALARALHDVGVAVRDFPAMMALLNQADSEMQGEAEDGEFLAWLREDNFVLLGHRHLVVEGGEVRVLEAENLGLLADPALPVFDALAALPALPERARAAFAAPHAVTVAKANMRSTVHRPQHADVIATRIQDPAGRVTGVRLFLGLFAAAAYNRNPRSIPLLRGKVERILATAGVSPYSHDGRALRNILDTWPRDELFQASEAEILEGARIALDLSIRPRPALFFRPDPFGRFVSVIAWLPREGFDTRLRSRVGEMLARAHGGRLSAFYIALGDAPLARVHYIIGTDPGTALVPDHAALEAAVAQAARSFGDRLTDVLVEERGEAAAGAALAQWRDAFPPSYRETETPGQAVADLSLAEEALASGRIEAAVQQPPGCPPQRIILRLAVPGHALALADALPLFESLDLRALEEVPHRLSPQGAASVSLHVFTLDAGTPFRAERAAALLAALEALLAGEVEADGFNRLVLRAGLDWRECWLLRAMYRWLKQVGFPFAQESVTAALAAQPEAARLLVDLFHARFRPDSPGDEAALDAAWTTLLDQVADPDTDRILQRLRALLDGMLRTNFYQGKPYLAFKLDSALAGEMPNPRPWREIFVHSASMEGCHLRAGPVARGGIRWSDRREDFRTEILGLMKAQRLKNVVIVPTGAKGGFVLKGHVPTDREGFQATGIAAYRTLVRGMLDLTDNLHGTEVVTAPGIRRRDGDDPYIVAAADKGTATFSDIANGLSAEYGFWLGDAFASGGSAGYDHKAMGITARGAWVMIERHFVETLGRSIHDAPFTVAGVGDMSGDVFGNGLLISKQAKLVAAFDHRHIFLDPDPDPARSHAERARLFALPRSSWADYDASLISAGGGVFARNLKTIPLSAQARTLLGITAERAEPAVVLQAILKLDTDLLYFGGIGTYVKASTETQAEAGDRANDAIRVDGRDIRARVVGEGANLGVTQAGRIEASRAGARINTDALDNSAGVSTSDHEVNIKILLADAEASGVMTRRQRDELLESMTDEVAALVLRDNHLQSVAVTLETRMGAAAMPAQAALMARLEAEGLLDRAQAGLPDAATMAARAKSGDALTRPEIVALLPFAKLWLGEVILASPLPDEPVFAPLLTAYFPTALQAPGFADFMARHRLRRDLIATALANMVVNRLGCAGLARLVAGAEPAEVVAATWLAAELFGLEARFEAAEAAAPGPRLTAQAVLRELLEAAAVELLPATRAGLEPAMANLAIGVTALSEAAMAEAAEDPALPAGLGRFVAAAPRLAAAPAIVRLAAQSGAGAAAAARAWAEVGAACQLDALAEAARRMSAPGAYGDRARAALLADLRATQFRLAAQRLAGASATLPEALRPVLADAAMQGDLAAVTVAVRALAAGA